MLYMCIEYIQVNMYHVGAQGVDERMINVHYYYYMGFFECIDTTLNRTELFVTQIAFRFYSECFCIDSFSACISINKSIAERQKTSITYSSSSTVAPT